MQKILIPFFVATWVLFTAVRTIFILLGWIFIPIAAAAGAYEYYQGFDGFGNPRSEYAFTWKWMFPWGNFEDGIANDTYVKFDSMFMKIVYWSAFRNPANNLRIIPYLSVQIDPSRVKWMGSHKIPAIYDLKPPSEEWFIAWQGIYSNWWWQFSMFSSIWRLWIGWKIFPDDVSGVDGHRSHGAGFATQFKRLK